jgi:hypothetical protein
MIMIRASSGALATFVSGTWGGFACRDSTLNPIKAACSSTAVKIAAPNRLCMRQPPRIMRSWLGQRNRETWRVGMERHWRRDSSATLLRDRRAGLPTRSSNCRSFCVGFRSWCSWAVPVTVVVTGGRDRCLHANYLQNHR